MHMYALSQRRRTQSCPQSCHPQSAGWCCCRPRRLRHTPRRPAPEREVDAQAVGGGRVPVRLGVLLPSAWQGDGVGRELGTPSLRALIHSYHAARTLHCRTACAGPLQERK